MMPETSPQRLQWRTAKSTAVVSVHKITKLRSYEPLSGLCRRASPAIRACKQEQSKWPCKRRWQGHQRQPYVLKRPPSCKIIRHRSARVPTAIPVIQWQFARTVPVVRAEQRFGGNPNSARPKCPLKNTPSSKLLRLLNRYKTNKILLRSRL